MPGDQPQTTPYTKNGPPSRRRTTTPIHLLILTTLAATAALPGLTSHGLTNWQESVRLVVAREMQAAWLASPTPLGGLATPTIHGQPYLAKPPLFYWAQIALAQLRGDTVSLLDLRLTAALAGILGVLATWLAARTLLAPPPDDPDPTAAADFAQTASLWAAAFTATGILTVRAARIGELDVLLLPITALAVAAAHHAYRTHLYHRRTSIPAALALAALAAAAALTKGPPGIATFTAAAILTITFHTAASVSQPRRTTALTFTLAAATLAVTLSLARTPEDARDIAGIALHALALAALITAAARALRKPKTLAVALARSGLPLALPAAALAMALWGAAMANDIGHETLALYAKRESANNLAWFIPSAPVRSLEALAYGAGLGSIAAIIAVVWIIKDRPHLTPGLSPALSAALAWTAAATVFTATTTGNHRYVLPVLPGVAILGALWFAAALRDFPARNQLRAAAALTVAALALGQGLWYGYARDRTAFAARSPRDFINELITTHNADPNKIVVFDFWTGALDIAAGQPVEPYSDPDTIPVFDFPITAPNIDTALAKRIQSDPNGWTIIHRTKPRPGITNWTHPHTRLQQLGFTLNPIPTTAEFLYDKQTTPIQAASIRLTP